MDMLIYSDFRNCLYNLEMGWTNWYWVNENIQKLIELKTFALDNRKEFQKAEIDLIELYKQIDEFNSKVRKQETITGELQEAMIRVAMQYAECGKPIICSINNEIASISPFHNEKHREKSTIRYKYDVFNDLIAFYLEKKENEQCFNELKIAMYKYIKLWELLQQKFPNDNFYNGMFYNTEKYLKYLWKIKDISEGKTIIGLMSNILLNDAEKEKMQKLIKNYFTYKIKG